MITNQETETDAVQHCEQCGLKLVGQVETFLGYCFSCIENETGLKEIQVSFSDPKKQTAAKAYLHYVFLKQHEIKDTDLREYLESTFETDGGLIVFHMVQAGFIRPADNFRTSKIYNVQNPPKPVRTWPPAAPEDAEEVEVSDVKDDATTDNEKTKGAHQVIEAAGKKYKCGSCSKSFDALQELAAHTRKEHRFQVEEFKGLVKEGKTEEEISSIMKRSIATISYHWNRLVAEGTISRKSERRPAPEKVEGIICPHCGSRDIRKAGFSHNKNGDVQVYRCMSCKHRFSAGSHYGARKKKEQAPGELPTGQIKPAGGEKGEAEVGIITSRILKTEGPEFREVTRIALNEDPGYRMRAAIIDSIGYDLKNGDNPIKALSYAVLENHTSRKISLEIEVSIRKEVL